ncbi:hypothetical protein OQA88_11002 [Cercophora sp. LCS_1]
MKLATILSLLPASGLAVPATSANIDLRSPDIEPLAANQCYLHDQAIKFNNLGCDHDPYTGRRKEPINASGRYQVSCYALGKSVEWTFETYGKITSSRWAFVPALGCWIWADFLQAGCLGDLEVCKG